MPNNDETHDDFMTRCMGDDTMNEDYPDGDQRAAVCEKQWTETSGDNGMMSKQWLRAGVAASAIGVDRKQNALMGMVVALEGPFKSEGRGEFDYEGLREITRLGNKSNMGLKSRFQHATVSDDGLGKFLGRVKELWLDKAMVERNNQMVKVNAVRGNLFFDSTAMKEPPGGGPPLGQYVMDLAESDPNAISSSLVLQAKELFRTDKNGKPLSDKEGNPLPPLWIPTKIHGSDIVDTGDAVDGLLSPSEMAQALSVGLTPELEKLLRFDNVQRLATQLLDGFFRGKDKDTVAAKCQGWLSRYLELRFPEEEPKPTPKLDAFKLRMREQQLTLDKLRGK